MGSDETATATIGGPRVIGVFDGNGAPSGPNYLLFSDVDRLMNSLRDMSEVGESPAPHAPALGAPQRALDPKLWQTMAKPDVWLRELPHIYNDGSGRVRGVGACTRPPPTQKRPQGDLGTANRQDFIDAAVMVGPSISRSKKIIFFGPQ